ncbi:MAG: cadherin domain-containing protein [Cohaesibacter sp.]|nr:cadherin domain-containing protein [Cohaesibacter sp.]
MADEKNTPSTSAIANKNNEVHRAQNSVQKAEADRSANSVHDYDTQSQSPSRMDILNPNLHYGNNLEDEKLISDSHTSSGARNGDGDEFSARSSGSSAGSSVSSLSNDQGSGSDIAGSPTFSSGSDLPSARFGGQFQRQASQQDGALSDAGNSPSNANGGANAGAGADDFALFSSSSSAAPSGNTGGGAQGPGNQAPTDLDLSATSVDENAQGAVIGILSVRDDSDENHTYEVNDDRFEIIEQDGKTILKLKDGVSLDYEKEGDSLDLIITVTDEQGASYSETFSLTIADINEAVEAQGASVTTDEDASRLDGQLVAKDPDGDQLTFSLVSGPSEGSVTLNADGSYSFVPGDDFQFLAAGESRTVSFQYRVEDGRGSSDTETVTIKVTGNNDAPSAVELSNTALDENADGVVVGTLSTSDLDLSDSHSYSVNDPRFEIVEQGGNFVLKVKDGISFDYEKDGETLSLDITVQDSSGASLTQNFVLSVNDLNEAVIADDASETTSENTAFSSSVSATDGDGDVVSYSLVAQPGQGSVVMNADGSYRFDPGADFDDLAVGESRSITFDYVASDGKGSTDTATVTINVTGTNDGPSAVQISSASIAENSAGAVVGGLTTLDVDASDSHSYSVSDSRFEVVDDNGTMTLKLKDGVSLDYENENGSVDVTVTSNDGNGGIVSEAITVTLINQNDAPTDIAISGTSLDENDAGAVVGTLTTTDADGGDSHTYTVSDSRFEVKDDGNGNMQLKLKDGQSLDHEAENGSVTVSVTTTDSNGGSYSEDITISVTDQNDAVDAADLLENMSEDRTMQFPIYANDQDGDSITLTILTQPSQGTITPNGGPVGNGSTQWIMFNPGNDFQDLAAGESRDVTFTYRAEDGNGSSDIGTVTLRVQGTNDAPTAVLIDDTHVAENAAGAIVGTLSTSDVDSSDTHTYSVSDNRFEIGTDGNGDPVLKLKDGVSLDHEAADSITVAVTTNDGNGGSHIQNIVVSVDDVNEGPSDIAISGTSVAENAAGAVIGTLTTTDADGGDSHSYTVSDSRFEVKDDGNGNMQLKLKDGQSLDHEAENGSVTVSVTTNDGNGGTYSENVTITISDVNDGPSDIAISGNSIAENAAGAVVGTLTTTDQDGGDSHSYTVSDSRFEVKDDGNGNMQLKLKDGQSLDREAENGSVTVSVTTTDGNGGSYSENITVSISDVNDAPTDIAISGTSIAENDDGAVVGTLTTTDDDSGNSHSYTVSDSRFEVKDDGNGNMQLKLKDGQSLDREAENGSVTVSVTTNDGNGGSCSENITISISDVNDAPTDIAISGNSINENDDGAVVGTLTTTDDDGGNSHSYTVSDSRFEIKDDGNGNMQLKLKDGQSLDHEAENGSVTVSVTTNDGNGGTYSENITVTIANQNDGPSDIAISGTSVTENDDGAVVGTLTTTDQDSGDSHTYTVSDSRFEVINDNGAMKLKLKDGQSLDREAENGSVTVSVTTNDGNGGSYSENITISISDVNEAPTDIAISGTTVAENAAGAVVGTLTTTDPDNGDSHSYTVSDSRFEVKDDGNGNMQLKLKDGVSLDHESASSVTVSVTSNDGNGGSYSEDITVSVSDVNEAPTSLDVPSSGSIAINNAGFEAQSIIEGHSIYRNIDGWDTTGQIVGLWDPNASGFGGNAAEGENTAFLMRDATVSQTLDETLKPGAGYSLSVKVGDRDGVGEATGWEIRLYAGNQLLGSVDNSDFNPGDGQFIDATLSLSAEQLKAFSAHYGQALRIELFNTGNSDEVNFDDVRLTSSVEIAVDENDSNGTAITQIGVNDPDDGDTHTYSLVDDANGAFSIDANTGIISVADGSKIDYETAQSMNVTVRVTDSGGLSHDQVVAIAVKDSNDGPSDIAISGNSVAENAAGAVVGTLTTTDADGGDSHTYTVSDSRFEVVDDNGTMKLKLKDGQSLDRETENGSVTVSVTTTDSNGGSYSESITINISDVNDAPTDIAISGTSIAENDDGAVVGTLTTTDQDSGNSHTYTVSDSRFEVIDDNGTMKLKLKDGQSLDRESENGSVTVSVTTNDGNGGSYSENITITISDVNDAPTDIAISGTSINENDDGAVVGTLTTTDADSGDSHSYTVSDSRFEVINDNGAMKLKLKDGQSLDHEAENGSVTVSVTTNDGNGGSYSENITVTIADVNDGPSDIAISGSSIAENAAGAVVGTLTTTDQDSGDSHTYTVSDSRFEVINDNGAMKLKLKDGQSLDREAENGSVDVTVTTNDGNGGSYSESITINISNVNEAPTDIAISGNSVAENAAGAVVGTLTTTDPDSGDSHSYTVSDSRFEVKDDGNGNMQLKLKDGVSLDHESESSVTVSVTSNDGNGGSYSENITVSVNDANDAPDNIMLSSNSANLLTNGSFESASLPSGAGGNYAQTGWTSNSGGTIETWNNFIGYTASDGNNLIELDKNANHQDSIQQSVTTEAGKTYNLSFDTIGRSGGGDDMIEVYWNGQKVGEVTASSTSQWEKATFEVVGTGGNDVLEFRETAGGDTGGGALMDNVSLQEAVYSVDENAAGSVIGTLTSSDDDRSDSHTYSVSDSRFEVINDNGAMKLKLKDGQSLDHEAENGSVTVTITSNDGNGGTYNEDFTISVNDVNEAPTDINLSANSVDENDAGAVVGTLTTTDADVGDSHTYSVSDSRFEVINDNGAMKLKLKDGVSLDHEAASSVSVRVTTNDGNGGTYNEDFSITVNDVNDIHLANSNSVALEDSTGVLNFHAPTQLPSGSGYSFEIVTAPAQGSVGNLYGNTFFYNTSTNSDGSEANFDYLGAGESTTITMQYRAVADDGSKSNIATHTFEVRGRNDYPDDIQLSNSSVQENSAGAVVGVLTSLDKDQNDTHTYTVNDNRFEVKDDGNGNMQLKLKDGVSLDHEQVSSITVRVTSNDGNGGTYSEDMVISVSDGNDAPTDIAISGSSVAENAAGAVVGTLTSTDTDSGDSHTYTVSDSRFEVVDDNGAMKLKLKAGQSLDHEGENGSVDVTVTSNDGNGGTYSESITISISDANDAPTDIALGVTRSATVTNASFEANALADGVSIDSAPSGWTLTANRGGTWDISGDKYHGQAIDGENLAFLDGQGGTLSQTLSETLSANTDLNLSVKVGLHDFGSTPPGYEVRLYAGNTLLKSVDEGDVPLVGNQMTEVTLTLSQDELKAFSAQYGQALRIELVGDNTGDNYHFDEVKLDVTDYSNSASSASVAENADGAIITSLTTIDQDSSDSHTYTVSDNRFEIVEDSNGIVQLKLKAGQSLDNETEASVNLTITTNDGNGGTHSENITVNVTDVNEAITGITVTGSQSVQESLGHRAGYLSPGHTNPQGQEVAALQAQDGDSGDSHTYSIVSATDQDGNSVAIDNAFPFEIQGNKVVVKSGATLDHESVDQYNIVVQAQDSGGNTATTSVSVDVTDYSTYFHGLDRIYGHGGASIALDGNDYASGSSENDTINGRGGDDTLIGNGGDDTINGGDHNDTLTGGGGNDRIEGGSGTDKAIYSGNRSDYSVTQNSNGTYTIVDTRSGSPDGTDTVSGVENFQFADGTLTVGNLVGGNFAPTDIALSANNVSENSSGAVVGNLSSTDANSGDSHTYTVSDSRFEVINDNGTMKLKLKDGQSLDHESADSISVSITTNDGNGGTYSENFTINVADVNEAPTGISVSGSQSVQESVTDGGSIGSSYDPAGVSVATLTTQDVDSGESHSYSILSATDNNGNAVSIDSSFPFEVQGNQIVVKAGASLDHESVSQYNIVVQSTDSGGETVSTNVQVSVSDYEGSKAKDGNSETIRGTSEEDNIVAGDGADTIHAGDGNDVINAMTGNARSWDDGATDKVYGEGGDDYMLAGFGAGEVYDGGSGTDTVSFEHFGGGNSVDVNLSNGDYSLKFHHTQAGNGSISNVENVTGSHSDDNLTGDNNANEIRGLNGNDNLQGMGGNDTLKGNEGNDIVAGNSGNDTIEGNEGDDRLAGNTGNDTIDGGTGTDTAVYSGDRADYNISSNGSGGFTIADTRSGSNDGTDNVSNVENFEFADGTVSSANLLNSAPTDMQMSKTDVAENASVGQVVGKLSTTDADSGDTFTYSLTNDGGGKFEIVGDEVRVKSALDYETNSSHSISVKVDDSAGNSYSENFTINVDDYAEQSVQVGVRRGGSSSDAYYYSQNHNGNNQAENVNGTNYADNIKGNGGNDILRGKNGNDTIDGGSGKDQIHGGNNNDQLKGGTDNDYLNGGAGTDKLWGESGDDFLDGGDGNDQAWGGDGNDTYLFEQGDDRDSFNGGAGSSWTDTVQVGSSAGDYNTDWTVNVTTSGVTTTQDGNKLLFDQDDVSGTINLSDGSQLSFENVEQIHW